MAKRLRKKSIAEEMRDRATGNNQTYTVEERKETVIPKQDMTPTPTLQDRINKHYVENMQNLANTTMNVVTNTVKRNPIVNSFMAGFNTGKNVELPQNQVKTIQNAVKKDLQTNTQDKRNPLMALKNQNEQKKEEEEKHKENVSYKPYQLPQAQEMVNKNQQEVDERKKNEEAQGLLSQVQNRTLPQAQKQQEAKKPTLTESIQEYLRTGDIRKSAGNYFKSQFEGGKQGVLEYGQYYNETLPSKVEGDSWTKRKSEEQYRAKEYREGLLNDVKQNPNNYSKEQKSFIKNQQEFTEKYGDNFYEAYKNESKEKVNKMIEEAPTEIDRKLIEIGQSNGQSAVGAGLGMLSTGLPTSGGSVLNNISNAFVNGLPSGMYFFGSSAQSYYDAAKEMGMAESDAWKYGNFMGAWEVASESLIAANRVDQVNRVLTGENIGKTGMKFLGSQAVENAFQEALSEPIDNMTKSMLNYSYLNEGQLGERMLESGMIGAISALLMDSPVSTFSTARDIVDIYNKSVEKIGKKATIEKMQKGAETYYAQILSEINNGLGNDAYEMMRNQNIQEENQLQRLLPGEYENQQEIDRTRDEKLKAITEDMTEGDKTAYLIQNSNLSQEEKDSLSRVARKLNVSAEQIDDLLKFNEEQKQIQSENNELEQMIDNSNLSQAQIGEVFAQKSFEEAKNKINELNEENNANQEAIKTLGLNISEENKEGNILYKEKQNIEINDSDTLESSYKKYYGENETSLVKRLKNLDKAAIESGQNVKLVFDAQYFKDNNGNLRTGTEAAFVNKDGKRIIAVNPYATTGKNFEQVLAHELTHAVLSEKNADTDMLYKTVEDYLKSKGEYDNAVKDLKGLYGDNYNEEEIVAKTIERIFDTKTELNDLANSQPNLFTRIYRNLVGLYAKITGSEKAYIKKLKLDMELAWKNSNNKGSLQDAAKYSIETNNDIPKDVQKLIQDEVEERFKNEDKTTITETLEELEKEKAEIDPDKSDKDWYKYYDIRQKINALKGGFTNVYDMLVAEDIQRLEEDYKYNPQKYNERIEEQNKEKEKQDKLNREIEEATPLKKAQYEVIQEYNPMFDDTHVGIRSPADIKTFDEVINDDESFTWGDYSKEDAERDLKRGKVTIYSSYPIKQGVFVSTSKRQAQEYAGGEGNPVYSREVSLNRVAWINGDEGQYANVGNKSNEKPNNIKYSIETTQDSQGRKLTKEQQEYFKDSKARDENGNLLTLYHGTPNGNFTVFRSGTYLTSNKNYADRYQNTSASSLGNGGKELVNPKTFEVYANIKKPFTLSDSKAKEIYINEYIKGGNALGISPYENNDFYDEIGVIDWTEGEDLKDWLQENYPEYDSIILDEGGDIGYDGENYIGKVEDRGESILVFNPNQIKNVDNKKPTSNPDIRYSMETTTDNNGNQLSKGQREYFNGSKAVDEKGNLVNVFHTTTGTTPQFNEFNPVGTSGYKFGNQVVNYYTDDKEMSGSYANQKYKMANTQKLQSMNDVDNFIDSINSNSKSGNEYFISENDGKYTLILTDSEIGGNVAEFFENLSEEEKQELSDNIYHDTDFAGTPYEFTFSWDKFSKELQKKYNALMDKYVGDEKLIDAEKRLYELATGQQANNEIATYDSQEELFKHLQEDLQKNNWTDNTKIQYSGYVNIQNPYVVDAKGRNWNLVDYESNEELDEVINTINTISDDTYNSIIDIYNNEIGNVNNAERKVNEMQSFVSTHKDSKFIDEIGKITILETIKQSKALKNNKDLTEENTTFSAQETIKEIAGTKDLSEALKYINKKLKEDSGYNGLTIGQFIEEQRDAILMSRSKYGSAGNFDESLETFFENNPEEQERFQYLDSEMGYDGNFNELLSEILHDGISGEELKQTLETYFIKSLSESSTETNDIVKQVIDYNNSLFEDYDNNNELAEQYGLSREETNKNRTPEEILTVGGYDGVIIRNTVDYGGKAKNVAPHDLYITFGSEQFKAADNKNPTLDKDIRYSEQTETADEILDRLLEKYRGKGERTYLPGIPKNLPKDYIMELGNKIEQMSIPDDRKLELYNLANTNDWNEESYNNFMNDLDGIEQDFKSQQQRDRFTTKSYDNPDRAELITRKRNEFNKDYHYNDKLVDEIDSLLPRNRNGKRLVREWKNFARELGKRLATDNYTPDEVEDIAVKSYYDLQPTRNLTTYDKNSISKKAPREKLYANDWVNSVYEGLNEAGYDATKYSITDNGQNNEQPALPQKELSNKLPVGQVNESKEDSLNAIREHHERELGDTINLEDIQNLPDLKGDKLEGDLPKTIDRIVDKRTKEKVTAKEFIKELKKQFVNKAYAVDKLAKQTGNKKLTHKYDRQLMAFNEAQVSLGDAQVNKDGRVVGKSLIETFKKAKDTGLDRVFADYLENKNNIARDKLGESLYGADVTAVQSRKIVEEYEKKYPQFKEWANDVSKYNDNLAESYLVGSFINQELWNKLKQLNPDYVPAFRDIVETKGLSDSVDNVGFQVLKRAEGGSSKILTPKEAMAEQTVNYVKAYRKNETIKELYKTIKGKLDSTDILYEDMETVPEIAYEMMREAVGKDQDGHYTATFFENGKATSFKVGKDIFDAFVQSKGIEAIEKNAITKVLGGTTRNIAQFQRNAVTTYSIPFLLKNMVRDYNDALINTQYSDLRFMKNYARAYIEMITKGKYYEQYKNAGGGANTYYDYEKGLLPGSTKNPLKKFINKVVSLNEYIETAPRLAEFISTMEKGGNLDEALYNAAEITTNFKRGGDTAKLINKYGANFFNASIQGADKVIRNITGQKGLKGYANLAVKTMIAGVAPSLVNHILISGSDDPEERKAYEELQDYIKNNYYLIYKGNGDFYRIPKGRIAGTIGAAAVGLYRTTQGEDDAFDGYFKNVLLENLAPNNPLTNNIIAPVLQAKKNDAWYDGTIYSETKYANKLPMEVTDEKVDDFSNLVAKGVNALFDDETLMKSKTNNGWLDILANPKKLNYVLDQYSGGFGDIVLPQLTPRAENNFIADQFTTSSVLKNKYVGEFYDMCDNNIGNSEYATDFDKLTYKYLEGKSKEVGKLYKEKHEIEQSDLPDEEKMKQSREKQKEINELCKEAVETVKGTKVTGNTAEFGGQTYYKDNEDEWKKVSEDSEMNMLYTVDATTYADWKNKTTAANKAKKESEGKGLTDKEKDAMLVNSTYRDEEKEAIYMDSMGKDDDVYKALKIIAQPDIDEYLTYQSQTFESKRVDDGTAKGKAVTKGEGTAKNQTINYLDNSNMSSAETEYIKATKYKLDSTAALREYIDSLNLSEEDYRTVMSNIKDSNAVELSDGTWKWK